MIIDLHLHSNYSDGKFKPAEVAERLAAAGIKMAALTDHDTVAGTAEFNLAAVKLGIIPINGVEITAYHEGLGLHILGLGINAENKNLLRIFAKQAKERKKGFLKAVKLFRQAGFFIDVKKMSKILKLKNITKPHIFDLIYSMPKNRKLAKNKYNLAEDERPIGVFIDQFMSLPGQIAYVKKDGIGYGEAIKAIHQAGGLAFLAHPGIEIEFRNGQKNIIKVIKDLKNQGLDGLEAFYSTLSGFDRTINFYEIAKKNKLMVSMGSDDHDGFRIGTVKVSPQFEKEIIKIWQ
ncbi:MAG: PHP domain-containing protein [Parcubacteria group bacterium Gr01-1014_44]|nr:MAG: PHP domain-containing protein [Parcubacteria group bacterium Gr01-1014_44]